ncbi:galactosyltransferase-related protein [Aeromonas sp. HMWF014]|uniref:galactosyltransferase-related protein n=1 Tax=Aeromonas sp. HMWF014 TaxID=2056850 RepID=UPI002159FF7B|nr:galactosyltransferase-related protein [Aeromonas sp. HMWF014]
MLNVITPLYINSQCSGDFRLVVNRLDALVECIGESAWDIYIPTNRLSLINSEGNLKVISDNQSYAEYSPGQARNYAVAKSSSKMIFMMDVDLLWAPKLAFELESRCIKCKQIDMSGFEMYPCLYLTEEETERFDGDFQGCLESYLRGENHRVEGIALASSCLLINREWFLQLGGFDEQFVGHGGEDLELIDRLTRHYPIGPRPDDYALNIKAQHPGDYQGFRRYFSYYALPHLFAGRFLVHQWHPRPLTHPYHRRRAGNDQLLEQMLSRTEAERGPLKGPVVPCNDLGGELPDFREWMIRLQEEAGYPVSEYPGLLRWQEGVQRKRPLWRKLRKLYLNPRAFFADMR